MAPKSAVPLVEIHGYAMRVIREARGRKVQDLADAIKVHRTYIAHIENGTKRRISGTVYGAICRELLVDDHRALLANAPLRDEAEDLADVSGL